MILQELVRYYDRKSRDPDPAQRLPTPGIEDKEIPFIIELTRDGQVHQLVDTRSLQGKKLRARSFLVPLGEKKTSGLNASLERSLRAQLARILAPTLHAQHIGRAVPQQVGLDAGSLLFTQRH